MKAVSYNQGNGGHKGFVPRVPTGPCSVSIPPRFLFRQRLLFGLPQAWGFSVGRRNIL